MSETKVSKAIRDMIRSEFPQIQFTRLQTGVLRVNKRYIHMAETGWPDRIGYLTDGRMFGLEVKTPDGTLSPEQIERGNDITSKGGVFIVADSVGVAREAISKVLQDKCDTCIHKGAVYDMICNDCKWFYGSKFEANTPLDITPKQ